jgi:hypothetical protein
MAFHSVSSEYYPEYGLVVPMEKRILPANEDSLMNLLMSYEENVMNQV